MKSLLLFFMVTLSILSFAQHVAINTSGNPADASAILDVSASGKGILIPRMMPLERANIQNPANGLLVYDLGSNSFWYYANGWQEIGGSGNMNGPAGGDLNGSYPAPNVAKLQNLDVAFGVPFDKQVLKWDASNNNWKGRNDSLFLPYNVTYGSPSKLFGITNLNTTDGSSAIYGRSGVISGINPGFTMGVWGDNGIGMGVAGTSSEAHGVFGSSIYNHGIVGYSGNADFAGVYGSHAESNGIGVMGETEEPGIGILGRGKGSASIAGRFENTHPESTYMTLDARNLGKGIAGSFWTNNPDNTSPTLLVTAHSMGNAIFALHDSIGDNNSAIRAWHLGVGEGVYAKSKWGNSALMIIDNIQNHSNALNATTIGNGSAGMFAKAYLFGEGEGDPAVMIENFSRSVGLKVKSLFQSQLTAAIDVEYGGYSYAVNINSVKGGLRSTTDNNQSFAVFGNNTAIDGTSIQGIANAHGGRGVHGSANGSFGIGLLGTSSSPHGYGVKGEGASDIHAAVTGINTGSGGGVHGINQSAFGYGVIGDCGDLHGVAGHFRSTNEISEISPAIWTYTSSLSNGVEVLIANPENQRDALHIVHQGTGSLATFGGLTGGDVDIANNGNISTNGTVTVKNNKGIVRTSSSAQKRMETLTANLIHFNMPVGAMVTQTVTFAQAFSTAPIVTLGNINSGFTGPCEKMIVQIRSVSTTGCTVTMYNPAVSGDPDVSGTWNLLAIGNE